MEDVLFLRRIKTFLTTRNIVDIGGKLPLQAPYARSAQVHQFSKGAAGQHRFLPYVELLLVHHPSYYVDP